MSIVRGDVQQLHHSSSSSSIYKVIRPVLNFFFYDKISQVQKSTKKH